MLASRKKMKPQKKRDMVRKYGFVGLSKKKRNERLDP